MRRDFTDKKSMIELLLAAGSAVAALVGTALVFKRPPHGFINMSQHTFHGSAGIHEASGGGAMNRWASLLNVTTEGFPARSTPVGAGSSAWNAGASVQPVEFTRQLASLQHALAQSSATPAAQLLARE